MVIILMMLLIYLTSKLLNAVFIHIIQTYSLIQWVFSKVVNQEIPQNPWHRETKPHNNYETPGRQTKQSNQLSLPVKMIAKLEWTQSNAQQNIEQLQNPTVGVTISNEPTTTEPPP